MRPTTLVASVSALTLAATLTAAPALARPQGPETIVDGLAGPLTLALGTGNDIYVTESFAGRLTKVDKKGGVHTVHQMPDPESAEVVGVDVAGKDVYHIETDYAAWTSHLVKTSRSGARTVVSEDFLAYEEENNPDGGVEYGLVHLDGSCADEVAALEEALGFAPLTPYPGIVESHAYQITVAKDGIYVADAAANAVLRVDHRTGDISTAAVLPATPITFTEELKAHLDAMLAEMGLTVPECVVGQVYLPESVPTDVKVDQHGRLYVTTLEGAAGEALPLSKVYRIDQHTGQATVLADGLSGATGLDRAPNGTIYVAEMFGGTVSVVTPGSSTARTLFSADSPADVEVSGRHVYATTGTFGNGALVRYLHTGPR